MYFELLSSHVTHTFECFLPYYAITVSSQDFYVIQKMQMLLRVDELKCPWVFLYVMFLLMVDIFSKERLVSPCQSQSAYPSLSHTQNTTQVVDWLMGYVIISPLSIIIIRIHITKQT